MENRTSARQLDEIYTLLHQRLSPRRIAHVLGVAHMALRLASRWGADLETTLLAALLHDIAKEHDHQALLSMFERHLREIHPEDEGFPGLWHAAAGEIVAREELGISSPEVCMAIRLHPTGREDMSLLEEIIFLSDFIEPSRRFSGVEELRLLSETDLRAAMDSAIVQKTDYVQSKGGPLHARAARLRVAALRRLSEREAPPEIGKGSGLPVGI